jgi:putative phosphoserine phosphatase/1-acylglycerol-3-phosphate O-acyltransferase
MHHLRPAPERLAELAALPRAPVANFFDIDGTLFTQQLTIEYLLHLGWELQDRTGLTKRLIAQLDRYRRERPYQTVYPEIVRAAVALLRPMFTGLREEDALRVARSMVDDLRSQTYLFTRLLLGALVKASHAERGLIIAVTGAPQHVAELFVEGMGFDLVYGVSYHAEDGVHTGTWDERSVQNKEEVVREIASTFALDLAHCIAVGDTVSDISMLQSVGYPVAMNPAPELLAMARACPEYLIVSDRQKQGILYFSADQDGKLHETDLSDHLPGYLKAILESPSSS